MMSPRSGRRRPFSVGCDPMDLAAVAGRDEQIATAIECKRPDVLRLRIVEGLELSIAASIRKTLPSGAVAAVDPIAACRQRSLEFEGPGMSAKMRDFPAASMAISFDVDAAGAAAAGIQVAFRSRQQAPTDKRLGWISQFPEDGRKGQAAIAAQRQVLEGALFEIGLAGMGPAPGLYRDCKQMHTTKSAHDAKPGAECGRKCRIM